MVATSSDVVRTYSVTVTNTGATTGDEVVFAFYSPPAGAKFIRALFGFKRVHLAPGASTVVSFTATAATFRQVLPNGDAVAAPGLYRVMLTNGVAETVNHEVELTGQTVVLEAFPKGR